MHSIEIVIGFKVYYLLFRINLLEKKAKPLGHWARVYGINLILNNIK